MNRRNFLKAAPILAVGLPAIANRMAEPELMPLQDAIRESHRLMYDQIWREKLHEHKLHLERALLHEMGVTHG